MERTYRTAALPMDMAALDELNEHRADRAEAAVALVSDCAYHEEIGGVFTDLSDTLACLMHLADRAGVDWDDVCEHATRAYYGDREDGPQLAHDVERFPTVVL